jgi:hypothetical protein
MEMKPFLFFFQEFSHNIGGQMRAAFVVLDTLPAGESKDFRPR